MTATFLYAVRYQVGGLCQTPLRTGGADGDTEVVLRDHRHRAFLQGASLAGALREWCCGTKWEEILFGTQKKAGQLIVSDAFFEENAVQSVRPRLRINGKTGSADAGGKFDVAGICAGSAFSFELVWTGTEKDKEAIATIEQMLSALDAGQIRLGAQKSNGFGQVSLLSVSKHSYDMMDEKDRKAWLSGVEDGEPFSLPPLKQKKEIIFEVSGYTDGLLVKSSSAEHGETGSVIKNWTENGKSILPGSSIKGAIRGRISAIAEFLHCPDMVEEMFGCGTEQRACGLCGQLRFEDAILSGQTRKISRIRINRFTGGVIRGGLFSEEPISSEVKFQVTVPDGRSADCGLLLYALRDLALGLYPLGSGASIGRGRIHLETVHIMLPNATSVCLQFNNDGHFEITEGKDTVQDWMQAVEMRCRECNVSG